MSAVISVALQEFDALLAFGLGPVLLRLLLLVVLILIAGSAGEPS